MIDFFAELDRLAHPSGGWAYVAGQAAQIEPTALAILAHHRAGKAVPAHAMQFLQRCRRADGSYRPDTGRPEAVWGSSIALFARAAVGPVAADDPAVRYLLHCQGKTIESDREISDVHDINSRLVGWPWGEANFSWVEPTAWAVIALNRLGHGDHDRVRAGIDVLFDRAFATGGVNYGNRVVLGTPTEPMPGPTALWLIALQRHGDDLRYRATAEFLRSFRTTAEDVEILAWATLALELVGDDAGPWHDSLRTAVADRAARPWVGDSPWRLALAALALADGPNPFRYPDDAVSSPSVGGAKPPATLSEPWIARIKTGFQRFLVNGMDTLRQPPPRSAVHIARAPDYEADLASILSEQYAHFRETVPLSGKRVVLKPNLVEYYRDRVINTDPRVISAVIKLCRREGAAEVIVAEGPGHYRTAEYLVHASGLGEVLARHGVRFVDLNHDEPVKLPNLGRLTGLDYLYLARTVVDAEVFISMPKLKTHHWAGATLSLKNLFGTLPGTCYGWPKNELHWRGIPNSIVDIACTNTPNLAIVDGIVGMEGDGPINGTAKPFGVLVMGADPVAVDATCCRLMGLPAERIVHLHLAAKKRLGRIAEADIEQLGEPVAAMMQPFVPPPTLQDFLLPTA